MAELSWNATTPLSRTLVPGRHGAGGGEAGVHLVELGDFELVQVMARRGQSAAMVTAAQEAFGAPPPERAQATPAGAFLLVWSGPDQFLVLHRRQWGSSLLELARHAFTGTASLSDQSDGRALLRLSGPQARSTLSKCCFLDLHPKVFPPGTAAATSIDHTPVALWRGADRPDGAPVFHLLVFATFAASLLGTILDAAAEYGADLGAPEAWQS